MFDTTGITEHPEYQKSFKKLMGVHPSIRAVVDPKLVDKAYISDFLTKQFDLDELGLRKKAAKEDLAAKIKETKGELGLREQELESKNTQFTGDLNLARLKGANTLSERNTLLDINRNTFNTAYSRESGLGLQSLADSYNARRVTMRTELDRLNNQNVWGSIIGAANVGVSAYNAYHTDDYNRQLLELIRKRYDS